MKFITRLLVVIALIGMLVLMTLFLVTPQIIIDIATQLQEVPAINRALQIAVAVILDAALLMLIWRILRPRKEELIVQARGAKTAVSADSVQRQINTRIAQVSDVLHVHTEVEVTKGAAQVTLNVRSRPDINIPDKQRELSRVLRQMVEKQMGLKLAGQPIIHIALATDEYDAADSVTTVIDDSQPTVEAIAASTYSPPPPPRIGNLNQPSRSLPERSSQADTKEEPWREFLLGDDK